MESFLQAHEWAVACGDQEKVEEILTAPDQAQQLAGFSNDRAKLAKTAFLDADLALLYHQWP